MAAAFEIRCDLTIVIKVKSRLTNRWMLRAALAGLAGVGACGAPTGPSTVADPDPTVKIPAIKARVAQGDNSVVQQLIKDLENDDPAVRFYAINGLERLTGETFGYQYFVDEEQRAAAVEKWKAWLAGWQAATGSSDKQQ